VLPGCPLFGCLRMSFVGGKTLSEMLALTGASIQGTSGAWDKIKKIALRLIRWQEGGIVAVQGVHRIRVSDNPAM